jgi:arylsulfatase A-like enzyme
LHRPNQVQTGYSTYRSNSRNTVPSEPNFVLKFSYMAVSRRNFLMGALSLPALAADKAAVRPNIVLLVAENLPAWALGCYGNKEIRTPNLDRLAQTGTRFQRHFACAPVADAGRLTLLSGATPMQAAGAPTLEKLLSGAGYQAVTCNPADAEKALDGAVPGKPQALVVLCDGPRAPYDGVAQKYKDLYAQTRFATLAPEPPSARAAAGKEMLTDLTASTRKYAAAVSELDARVQAVIAKVYQRKLQDETILIFTSTSGALLGHHGLWGAADGSEPPNMYEETIATPMIWSWVGDVPAQGLRPEVVSAADLVPTMLDIAGVKPAANLWGRSYRLPVTGKPLPAKQPWRTTTFARHGNTEMARSDRYKLVLRDQGRGAGELFDMRTDPGERINQYANPEFETVRTSLAAELNGWRQKYSG